MDDRTEGASAAPAPLAPERLRRQCDPAVFPFETTNEAEPIEGVVGQDRAVAALEFGVGIRREGYNVFALGPPGTGKHSMVRAHLERAAAADPVPDDWCYVHGFDESHKPQAIRFPAGQACVFASRMDALIRELKTALPTAFESEEYRSRRQMIEGEYKDRQAQMLEGLQAKAREKDVALMRTPMGLMFAPMLDGDVLKPEAFEKLPEADQERIKADIEALQAELQETMAQVPAWDREQREKIDELNGQVTQFAVGHLIDALREDFKAHTAAVEYLNRVQADIVENAGDFIRSVIESQGPKQEGQPSASPNGGAIFRRYQVNVIIDNRDAEGAPVVYEDHPALGNLIGRIEHTAQFGALITDFNLIKPGALHRANGGYLILDTRRLLMQPLAWEELKRTLRAGEIRIESLGQAMSIISTISLEPQEIPLSVKVVLVGDRQLYHLMRAYDPDFDSLFKVQAEFGDRIERTEESVVRYGRLIATLAQKYGLKPFDRGAVARTVEYSQRVADDSERLSVSFQAVLDLMTEAEYWAGTGGNGVVTEADVQRAVDSKIHRADWVREQVHEGITRDTILIDTEGSDVGQVNGLSVLQIGGFSFGKPSRITARVRLGKGEVVDIERQVELGGPLHSKGVLILAGFLGARFAAERPLSLAATLVFEQSYGGVDGDSASSTELYAILSALAEAPIRQGLAVTGSVNQNGEVQAIGGVNQKIEGFFDICAARGLTGEQGVLIPVANVKHLMLRQDVVEAAAAGRFHIYPITTIDQGISLLTGVEAGKRDTDGAFPAGSINGRVESKLIALTEAAQRFARAGRKDGEADA